MNWRAVGVVSIALLLTTACEPRMEGYDPELRKDSKGTLLTAAPTEVLIEGASTMAESCAITISVAAGEQGKFTLPAQQAEAAALLKTLAAEKSDLKLAGSEGREPNGPCANHIRAVGESGALFKRVTDYMNN